MWDRGTVLGDRYRLAERLGGGAMGEVWRADDDVLERQVAVKILLPALLDDATFMERFRREAKLLAALNHPGIVEVHDYGESTGDSGTRVAYIVMELITGRPLDEALRESGPMPADLALGIVAQALDALHVAHRRQIVHRDIKPSNLMLRDDNRVVVTDFGIASAIAGTRITSSNAILGTALYVAPERAEGASSIAASDLYSMGVLCYELLTGEPPFTGETALEIVLRHIREPAPELPAAFPQPVRELVAKALAKRPQDRFSSAAVMAATARRASAAAASAGAVATTVAGTGTIRLLPDAPVQSPTAVLAPTAPPPAEGVAALAAPTIEQKPRPRRGWRNLLIPVIIPCTLTVGVGTALLIDPSPYRSNANAPGAQTTAVASGSRLSGAAALVPGLPSAGASVSAGATPPTASGAASAPPSGVGVPSSGGAAAPGTGGAGALPPAGGAGGSGGQPVTKAQGGGSSSGTGGTGGGTSGTVTGPTTAAPAQQPNPPAPAPQPATPNPPAGCGGTGWGAIVNVGDHQRLGLAADRLSGGTTVVTGGATAYGWVHWADAFARFNACSRDQPALAEVPNFSGQPATVELAAAGDFMTSWSTVSTGSGSYLIKDYIGQNCLTDNGVGAGVTVGTCSPGSTSQEWLLP